jgi:hypothetical protein
MPAMPEQNTKPPATIAWLYGPSAAGARSLDTARRVIVPSLKEEERRVGPKGYMLARTANTAASVRLDMPSFIKIDDT